MSKITHKIFQHKTILLILVLAFILRIYDISNNPNSMYGDELTLVYDAYSLLKTGQDQKGESWPLFFSMGGGRPAGYIYATIPFTALFGPTVLAARMVSVLSGVGITLLIYLITRLLFFRRKTDLRFVSDEAGLTAALVAAITPWELNLSRGAFESHFALFLSLLGLYFFLLATRRRLFYLFSALSFFLSMQTYLTYVLSVPLFVGMLAYFAKDKLKFSPIVIASILILILSLIFSIYTSISRGSKDRVGNLFIYNQSEYQNIIADKVRRERLFSPVPSELAPRLHNKYFEFINVFFQNYLNSFGLDFLILNGDKNIRHNPTSMGQTYWIGLPLIIFGVMTLIKNHKKSLALLSGWLLIGPLASSIVGQPHAIRSSFMLPPLIILMGTGLYYIIQLRNKKIRWFRFILFILFLVELPIFLYRFYLLSPALNTSFWSYGARKAVAFTLENKDRYQYIILSTSIPDTEYAYPVYFKIEPKEVLYANSHKINIGEHQFLKYDNVYLGSIPSTRVKQITRSLEGSVLYLGPIEDRGFVDNEKIARNKDGSPLFVISYK